jgi:hypothetical protein
MWRDAAEEGIEALGDDSPAGKRLAEMRDFLAFMLKEITAMYERWHAEREARMQGEG